MCLYKPQEKTNLEPKGKSYQSGGIYKYHLNVKKCIWSPPMLVQLHGTPISLWGCHQWIATVFWSDLYVSALTGRQMQHPVEDYILPLHSLGDLSFPFWKTLWANSVKDASRQFPLLFKLGPGCTLIHPDKNAWYPPVGLLQWGVWFSPCQSTYLQLTDPWPKLCVSLLVSGQYLTHRSISFHLLIWNISM